ncbi:MAG: hypothetical protein WDZ37_03100 [Solirubrobacterales bacterium]
MGRLEGGLKGRTGHPPVGRPARAAISPRPRGRGLGLLAALALMLAAPGIAQAEQMQSVAYAIDYPSTDSRLNAGAKVTSTVRVWDTTGAKPLALRHLRLPFPRGGRVNGGLFKTCDMEELEHEGEEACPKGSKVGTGKATADARPVVTVPVDAKLTLFNGEPAGGNPTILIYGEVDLGTYSELAVTVRAVARKQRKGPYGYVLDIEIPPLSTLPGQPPAALTFARVTTLDRTARRRGRTRHYIEAPLLCTGTFFMLDGAQFTYEGGRTVDARETFTIGRTIPCP